MENPFAPPDIYTARRILAIQPHYDDNDISAGGTLALLAQRGAEVHYLTATDDLVGVIDDSLSDEEAAAQLKAEQHQAGAIIGVKQHHWLGYPDAGKYDYFDLRRDMIKVMRIVRPDFIFMVDAWMPYEAHHDHIITGKAAAEAAILCGLTRLKTDPEVDAAFEPFDLHGIAFYASAYPNTLVDISATQGVKKQAVSQYRAQFDETDMGMLLAYLDYKAAEWGREQGYAHAERFKVLSGRHLHVYPEAWQT